MAKKKPDNSPMLSGALIPPFEPNGFEPMIGGGVPDLRRLGTMQKGFLLYIACDEQDTSMLDCWRWVHKWTGNDRVRKKRLLPVYNQFTSAGLGRLIHTLVRRGLILVVKDENDKPLVRMSRKWSKEELEILYPEGRL